jgi:hypothetical protein
VKVGLVVPMAVGVPEMVPVLANARPAGRVPLTDQVYGAVPPVALSEELNDAFITPADKLVVLIASGDPAATTDKARMPAAVWTGEPASLTVTPIEKLPLTVGVPEINPVVADRLSPEGRAPEEIDQVYDPVPPLACRAWE